MRGKPFGPNNPPPGRKGSPNKITTELREAVIAAANAAGEDGEGKNGLAGYLTARANDPDTRAAFLGILGRCLPKQIDATVDSGPVRIVVETTMPDEPKPAAE